MVYFQDIGINIFLFIILLKYVEIWNFYLDFFIRNQFKNIQGFIFKVLEWFFFPVYVCYFFKLEYIIQWDI